MAAESAGCIRYNETYRLCYNFRKNHFNRHITDDYIIMFTLTRSTLLYINIFLIYIHTRE